MANLLVKPKATEGHVTHVTPESAAWTYVGFDLYRLKPGEMVSAETGDREVCLVWISGRSSAEAGGTKFGSVGERQNPFDGPPWALYVPAGSNWSATAETDLELAVCSGPGGGDYQAKLIPPDTHPLEIRGKGANVRHVHNIMPETDGAAHSLLVVEVVTPSGNTSSYPSHKHDRDDLPNESQLEETYYHRLNPPQGFAFQRVYTDDRSLDEAMAVEDGDVVLVPKGYHPCATIHGYDLYYLNVMAGPKRIWKFHNQKEHEWLLNL
ncbi:MAG: 5-deoxy-glucuronate isomerase [Hoeflea sp.]|uniref:5-deoxy-glucuronate isomerase n=1 Tax=Hoeflea sp. TaxID=1940281 RepID=UPI001D8CB417|nr:5-deoxy-glucuronate isomerase [Hoeflea sp.]MBU4528065.1 5-deoxy-glucuronate isomerase [Alphaproteobacteria bacterium]MBU4543662.1 5-deoxy-glucuronate isomerase [Alphaproteobacteria bacterium]MBU4548528.1 5-deoxy-glucuronate isomerase [Alphaproteobacteria bacterium]MBV1725695.1 5-deoxy-glucuronate isomerase [Hoeflea sp.]MBV1762051.1 5-deoxy-glucuronate isomerase [Hoeflea sp.]